MDLWTSLNTSLAVTKQGLDPKFVSEALKGGAQGADLEEAFIHSGVNWWSYTLDESFAESLDSQIGSLVARISPRLTAVKKIRDAGYSVQVAIAGFVEPRQVLPVSSAAVAKLASLGLPVSFTTLKASGPSEDPLAWLD